MGKTYPRVVDLLKREFEDKKVTKYAFCKKTGINPTSVERYLYEISEPTQTSLQKLSDYFGVSVAWLRGEEVTDSLLHDEIIEIVDEIFKNNELSLPKEKRNELTEVLQEIFNGKKIDRLSLKKQIERLLKIM